MSKRGLMLRKEKSTLPLSIISRVIVSLGQCSLKYTLEKPKKKNMSSMAFTLFALSRGMDVNWRPVAVYIYSYQITILEQHVKISNIFL